MATKRSTKVADTRGTTNLDVPVTGERTLDEMESLLRDAAAELGMYCSHITVLGTRRYPGNRHWHFERDPGETGCLDVTYWPTGPSMWISMRTIEPAWVHEAGRELGAALTRRLTEPPDPIPSSRHGPWLTDPVDAAHGDLHERGHDRARQGRRVRRGDHDPADEPVVAPMTDEIAEGFEVGAAGLRSLHG